MGENAASSRQIKIGAVVSYLAIFINIVAALIYTPWMVAKIGQSDYALYTLSVSLISIFMMDFGISSAVARFVAKYRAEGKEEQIKDFLGVVYKLFLAIACLIFVVLAVVFLCLGKIYRGLSPDEIDKFKILYLIVAGYSLFSFPFMPLDGILNSYEKFIQIKVCDLCRKLLTIGLIIVALIFDWGVFAVVASNAIAGIFVIGIKLVIIRKSGIPSARFTCRNRTLLKDIFTFSIWVTIMSIAQRCIFNLAPSILGIVSNSKEIAIFSPASALEGYFYTFAAAINGLFLPKVSRYIAENQRGQIMRLMIKIGKYQMLMLGLIFAGFCVVGKDFMILWMGEEYAFSYYGAMLILIPDLLSFSQQIATTMMIAENKVKLQSFGYILMAGICLGSSFVLSHFFGCLGACIAIALGYLVNYVYINIVYSRALRLPMKEFYKKCYARTLPVIIGCIAIGFVFMRFITRVSWLFLLLKGSIVVVLYGIFAAAVAFTKEERKTLVLKAKGLLRRKSKQEGDSDEETGKIC